MPFYFRAVAIDYDGTLTETSRPGEPALAAIGDIRQAGRKVILVTGRILSELRADFPEVDTHFDLIVAENGAVLSRGVADERLRSVPVSADLAVSLARRGVPVRRGRVLLATDAVYDVVVLEEIRRLGLEAQMVWNRGALMVLPHGVDKGAGVEAALTELGVSYHNAVSIGDAENDHSLLEASEIGVAVANAVDSLKAHADVVLPDQNGTAVEAFLKQQFLSGMPGIEPRRWQVDVGVFEDGNRATIPGSRVNVSIYGGSGAGKSYFAGLFAEGLINLGYTVVILDLEGDHTSLAELHGVLTVGGRDALPPPEQIPRLILEGLRGVVVDLSLVEEDVKRSYAMAVLEQLRASRVRSGLPHWIVVEEAHLPMGADCQGCGCADPSETGVCLVTYQPTLLCEKVNQRAEIIVHLGHDGERTVWRRGWSVARHFRTDDRTTAHVRHWHKYEHGLLPVGRHFVFRDSHGPSRRSAGNLPRFVAELRSATGAELQHHSREYDFSRWLGDLLRDVGLVQAVREVERQLAGDPPAEDVDRLRDRLCRLVEAATPTSGARQAGRDPP